MTSPLLRVFGVYVARSIPVVVEFAGKYTSCAVLTATSQYAHRKHCMKKELRFPSQRIQISLASCFASSSSSSAFIISINICFTHVHHSLARHYLRSLPDPLAPSAPPSSTKSAPVNQSSSHGQQTSPHPSGMRGNPFTDYHDCNDALHVLEGFTYARPSFR